MLTMMIEQSNGSDPMTSLDNADRERYLAMIEKTNEDYSKCTSYIRLPGEMSLCSSLAAEKVIPGPMLSRTSQIDDTLGNSRDHLCAKYNIDRRQKILTLTFGGHQNTLRFTDAMLPEGWICLCLGESMIVTGALFPPRSTATARILIVIYLNFI
jgi:hypothetical protein